MSKPLPLFIHKLQVIGWLLLLAGLPAFSQENGIQVIAKSKKNAVWLRWAPTNPYVWELGNKYGYIVERFAMISQGTYDKDYLKKPKMLADRPIKPYFKEEFEKLAQTDDKAGAVAEMIYGEQFRQSYAATPAGVLKRNQEQENRFGMALFVCDLSQPVAIAAGLMWFDKSPVPGTQYAYRIRLAQKPTGAVVEDGVVVVDVTDEIPLKAPTDLEARFGDQAVTLKWPVLLHKGVYSAYYVEKSADGKIFKSISDLPYINLNQQKNPEYAFLVDSLADNDQTFHYRIKGITPFSEVSPPSVPVSGKGRRPLEAIVSIDSSRVLNNKQIFLHWHLPAGYEKWIKGFVVNRSDKPDGPYQDITPQLLPAGQRTFTDNIPENQNYYRIKYLAKEKKDGKDDVYYSFPYLAQIADETPPTVPVDLAGKVDSTGVVTLTWQTNKDMDIYGYRVYRANSLQEEFREITPQTLTKPALTDTIAVNTLTKKVYYRVVAVDRNFNPSGYSEPLTLNRPDRIAPVAPVFRLAQLKGDTIRLAWISSDTEDVARYRLYRKQNDSLVRLSEWPVGTKRNGYTDRNLRLGQSYRYVLQALDSAGNIGEVTSREILYETGVRKAIVPTVAIDRNKNLVRLQWKYAEPGVTKFVIYRAREKQPMVIYQTLEPDATQLEDKSVTVGNSYSYYIKAFFKGGMQSLISSQVSVTY